MLFPETQSINPAQISARTRELLSFHADENDCRIVAEAEDASLDAVLTFDERLVARLAAQTNFVLIRPAEYWGRLGIPRGTSPTTVPRNDNPMAAATWWRWVPNKSIEWSGET